MRLVAQPQLKVEKRIQDEFSTTSPKSSKRYTGLLIVVLFFILMGISSARNVVPYRSSGNSAVLANARERSRLTLAAITQSTLPPPTPVQNFWHAIESYANTYPGFYPKRNGQEWEIARQAYCNEDLGFTSLLEDPFKELTNCHAVLLVNDNDSVGIQVVYDFKDKLQSTETAQRLFEQMNIFHVNLDVREPVTVAGIQAVVHQFSLENGYFEALVLQRCSAVVYVLLPNYHNQDRLIFMAGKFDELLQNAYCP